MKRLNRKEQRALAALLLLCLVPVGIAWLVERRNAPRPRPKPIRVSQKTLAKYNGVVPLGGIGYVRLGAQGFGGGGEGAWDIYVDGPPGRDIEVHSDAPGRWKVEFVELLPDWNSKTKSIGVKVWVPESARQTVITGARVGMFRSRDGVQTYYAESFQVKRPAPAKTRRNSRLDNKRF